MKTMRNANCRFAGLLVMLSVASMAAHAQNAQWVWTAGKQSNDGQIVIKSVKTPGTSSTVSKNPTSKVGGQVVDVRQNATTQPPLIVQQVGGSPYDKWSFEFKKQTPSFP